MKKASSIDGLIFELVLSRERSVNTIPNKAHRSYAQELYIFASPPARLCKNKDSKARQVDGVVQSKR